jgi:hypothetical protein
MDWNRFMNSFQAAGRRPEQMSPMDEVGDQIHPLELNCKPNRLVDAGRLYVAR